MQNHSHSTAEHRLLGQFSPVNIPGFNNPNEKTPEITPGGTADQLNKLGGDIFNNFREQALKQGNPLTPGQLGVNVAGIPERFRGQVTGIMSYLNIARVGLEQVQQTLATMFGTRTLETIREFVGNGMLGFFLRRVAESGTAMLQSVEQSMNAGTQPRTFSGNEKERTDIGNLLASTQKKVAADRERFNNLLASTQKKVAADRERLDKRASPQLESITVTSFLDDVIERLATVPGATYNAEMMRKMIADVVAMYQKEQAPATAKTPEKNEKKEEKTDEKKDADKKLNEPAKTPEAAKKPVDAKTEKTPAKDQKTDKQPENPPKEIDKNYI